MFSIGQIPSQDGLTNMCRTLFIIPAVLILFTGCMRIPIVADEHRNTGSLNGTSQVPEVSLKTSICASIFLDPRAGFTLNSGHSLSTSEKIRSFLPILGSLFLPSHAVNAAKGMTDTEYRFYNGLDGLDEERDIGLSVLFLRYGKISQTEFDGYLEYVFQKSQCPDPSALTYILPWRLEKISGFNPIVWLYHWPSPSGPTPNDMEILLNERLISLNNLRQYLKFRIEKADYLPPSPNYLIAAEKYHILSKNKVDQTLEKRFWTLYYWAIVDRELAPRIELNAKHVDPVQTSLEKALIELHIRKD